MGQPRVLVAVSRGSAAKQLSVLLLGFGTEVTACGTLQEARHHLRSQSFDLLFTELEFSDGSGVSLLAEAQHQDLVSVAVGAKITAEQLAEALRLGICDVIFKPFTYHGVAAAFRRAVCLAGRETPSAAQTRQSRDDLPSSDVLGVLVPLKGDYGAIQKKVIHAAIHRFDGNKTAAAKALGLQRRRLYRLLDS